MTAGLADDRQIVQVARRLVRVVAVEQQAQGVGVAAQVLTVDEALKLLMLRLQACFEVACLAAEVFQGVLQALALSAELMQLALGGRDALFNPFELVGGAGAFAFGGRHFLAQRVNLIAQFLEVAFLLRDVGTRGSALVLRWGRGGPERSEQEDAAQACGEGDRAEGMQRAGAIGAGTFHGD